MVSGGLVFDAHQRPRSDVMWVRATGRWVASWAVVLMLVFGGALVGFYGPGSASAAW